VVDSIMGPGASCFPDAAGKLTFLMCGSDNAKGKALPVMVVFSSSEQVMGWDNNRTNTFL
jgi:hypothetical protein